MPEEEHPVPYSTCRDTTRAVPVDELGRVKPQVISQPAHKIQRSIPPHTNTVGRQCQMLPVPVEGYPSHGVQHPEDGEIQPIEGRDITRASTTRTITWEAISEAYLVWHQLGATGVHRRLVADRML